MRPGVRQSVDWPAGGNLAVLTGAQHDPHLSEIDGERAGASWAARPSTSTRARRVLDEDHFDLEKVKRADPRIPGRQEAPAGARRPGGPSWSWRGTRARSAAACNGRQSRARPAVGLCSVGAPPGVGKTSLAGGGTPRALGRRLVGYTSAGCGTRPRNPGPSAAYMVRYPAASSQGLRRAETRHPVFMLDEIDRSERTGAVIHPPRCWRCSIRPQPHLRGQLLRGVLRPVAGAVHRHRQHARRPSPGLRDRMEILVLSGYTDEEKKLGSPDNI